MATPVDRRLDRLQSNVVQKKYIQTVKTCKFILVLAKEFEKIISNKPDGFQIYHKYAGKRLYPNSEIDTGLYWELPKIKCNDIFLKVSIFMRLHITSADPARGNNKLLAIVQTRRNNFLVQLSS